MLRTRRAGIKQEGAECANIPRIQLAIAVRIRAALAECAAWQQDESGWQVSRGDAAIAVGVTRLDGIDDLPGAAARQRVADAGMNERRVVDHL